MVVQNQRTKAGKTDELLTLTLPQGDYKLLDSSDKDVDFDVYNQEIPAPGRKGTKSINTVAVIPVIFGSEKFKAFTLIREESSSADDKSFKTNFNSVRLNSKYTPIQVGDMQLAYTGLSS